MSKPRRAVGKIARRKVDGVLLLDKPAGISSNAALQKARWLFNAEKAGHTGTLDPMTTGLLPVCLGEATKFSSSLLDADKAYLATVRLGIVTDTADAEGQVLVTSPVSVTEAAARAAALRFLGDIEQVPPMHSALKRDGKPLYELARQGIEVERAPRRITIHRLEFSGWTGESFDLQVDCSKGTYVRTLAADIGAALGCGAHLAALRRLRVGGLDLARAVKLEQIEEIAAGGRDSMLLPVDALLAGLPVIAIDEVSAQRLLHGQAVRWNGVPGSRFRLRGPQGFIGVGELTADGWLQPKRLVAGVAADR